MLKSLLAISAIAALGVSTLLIASGAAPANTESAPAAASPSAQPTKPATQKQIRIGISIPAASHGWTAGIGWWARKAMEMYPDAQWIYTTAANPEKQISDIEDMMVKGIDGLVILATESAPLTPIAKKAKEQGIFIVNVDRGFLEPVADVFLEGDNKAFGRKSAQFIADRLKGKGNIVVLTGIPCTVDSDRVNAAKEVFAQYPDIKILSQQPGMWNRETALKVMEDMLTKFPKIDAVWAADDDMALGAMQAIKEAGREKQMWIFPGAGMKDVVKMVMDKDPMFPGNITYSPSMIATGIHTCYSILRDGKKDQVMQFMPRHLMIDVEIITPENAKNYYFPDAVY